MLHCTLFYAPLFIRFRKANLSAIMFAGMLVGGYLWGVLGDTYGRRRMLLVAMLLNTASGAASSVRHSRQD